MKPLMVLMLCASLVLLAQAQDDSAKAETNEAAASGSAQAGDQAQTPDENRTIVTIAGHLCCPHCEHGLLTECAVGIRVGDLIFLVEGDLIEALESEKSDHRFKTLTGTIRVFDGMICIKAEAAADPKSPNPIPGTRITGLVQVNNGIYEVNSGETTVTLKGKKETLARQTNRRIRLHGEFAIDADQKIVFAVRRLMTAQSTETTTR